MPHPAFRDRAGLALDCAAKVCSGSGISQLRLLLAEQDALFLGDGKRSDSPIVIMTVAAFKRLAEMSAPR